MGEGLPVRKWPDCARIRRSDTALGRSFRPIRALLAPREGVRARVRLSAVTVENHKEGTGQE